MTLPVSRNRTYVPGMQIASQDLNDLQDMIIAGKHGSREFWLSGADGQRQTSTAGYIDGIWVSATSGGSYDVDFPLPLHVGSRILSITVFGLEGNIAGETYAAQVRYRATTGAVTQVGVTKTSGVTGVQTSIGWTVADTGFTPSGFSILTNRAHHVRVTIAQTSVSSEVSFHGMKVVYDYP